MTDADGGTARRQAFLESLEAVADTTVAGRGPAEFVIGGYSFSFEPGLSSDDGVCLNLLKRVGEPGGASEAMRRVLGAADVAGIELELFARPAENTGEIRRRLVAWYEREGFVAVRGAARRGLFLRDGKDSLHMVRQPRPTASLDMAPEEGYEGPSP